ALMRQYDLFHAQGEHLLRQTKDMATAAAQPGAAAAALRGPSDARTPLLAKVLRGLVIEVIRRSSARNMLGAAYPAVTSPEGGYLCLPRAGGSYLEALGPDNALDATHASMQGGQGMDEIGDGGLFGGDGLEAETLDELDMAELEDDFLFADPFSSDQALPPFVLEVVAIFRQLLVPPSPHRFTYTVDKEVLRLCIESVLDICMAHIEALTLPDQSDDIDQTTMDSLRMTRIAKASTRGYADGDKGYARHDYLPPWLLDLVSLLVVEPTFEAGEEFTVTAAEMVLSVLDQVITASPPDVSDEDLLHMRRSIVRLFVAALPAPSASHVASTAACVVRYDRLALDRLRLRHFPRVGDGPLSSAGTTAHFLDLFSAALALSRADAVGQCMAVSAGRESASLHFVDGLGGIDGKGGSLSGGAGMKDTAPLWRLREECPVVSMLRAPPISAPRSIYSNFGYAVIFTVADSISARIAPLTTDLDVSTAIRKLISVRSSYSNVDFSARISPVGATLTHPGMPFHDTPMRHYLRVVGNLGATEYAIAVLDSCSVGTDLGDLPEPPSTPYPLPNHASLSSLDGLSAVVCDVRIYDLWVAHGGASSVRRLRTRPELFRVSKAVREMPEATAAFTAEDEKTKLRLSEFVRSGCYLGRYLPPRADLRSAEHYRALRECADYTMEAVGRRGGTSGTPLHLLVRTGDADTLYVAVVNALHRYFRTERNRARPTLSSVSGRPEDIPFQNQGRVWLCPDEDGLTPLELACRLGRRRCAYVLLICPCMAQRVKRDHPLSSSLSLYPDDVPLPVASVPSGHIVSGHYPGGNLTLEFNRYGLWGGKSDGKRSTATGYPAHYIQSQITTASEERLLGLAPDWGPSLLRAAHQACDVFEKHL
ncbi:hypothetical protein KIPB_002320, partial [Kipferlia bialata]